MGGASDSGADFSNLYLILVSYFNKIIHDCKKIESKAIPYVTIT